MKLPNKKFQRFETARQEINIVEDKISQSLQDERIKLLNQFSGCIQQ